MLKDFKAFILRGNVVDLAVGVIIGAAFGTVVNSLVKDVLTPFISAIAHVPKFDKLQATINNVPISYGNFINAFVSFMIVAFVVFFFIVQPINKLTAVAARKQDTPEPTTRKCTECFSVIAKEANRCAFCTSKVQPLRSVATPKKIKSVQ